MSWHLQGVWMGQGRIVGFRFVDPGSIQNGVANHHDLDFKNLQIAFNRGFDIRGLKVENGKLVGSNGQIDRYTKMDYKTGKLLQKTQLVVLSKYGQSKYLLCDGIGKVVIVSEKDMIDNIENGRFNIANGKLVNKAGVKYICQISGQYDSMKDPEEEKAKQEAKINKLAQDKKQFGSGIAKSMQEAREHAKSVNWSKEQASYVPAAVDMALTNQDETSAQYRRLRKGYINLAKDYIAEKGLNNASLGDFMRELKLNHIDDRLVEEFGVDLNKHRQTLDTMASSAYSTAEIEVSMKSAQQNLDDRVGNFEDCIKQPIVRETANDLRRSATEITTTRNKQTGEVKEITVREKLSLALYIIQKCEPFYFYVIQSLDIVETSDIPSMGVASKELVYNVDFVKDCQLAELVFVLMHEAQHALMGHVARGANKTHMIYNIAADLYINKSICDEFGLDPVNHPAGPLLSKNSPVCQQGNQASIDEEAKKRGRIRVRDDMLYSDKVDPDVDTVESLYDKIVIEVQNQMKKMGGSFGQSSQQQQGQQGQQQDGNGSDQNGQNGQSQSQNGQGQSQSGQGQSGQDQNSQGQNDQQGQGQNGQNQNGQGGESSSGQNSQSQQGQQGGDGSDQGDTSSQQNGSGGSSGQNQQNGQQGQNNGSGQQGQQNQQGNNGSQMSNQIWKDGPWKQSNGQGGGGSGMPGMSGQGQNGSGSNSGNQQGQQGNSQGNGQDQDQNGQGQNSNQLSPQEVDAVRKAVKKMFGVDPGDFKSDMVQTPSSANKNEEDLKRDVKNIQATANARMNQAGQKAYSTGLQAAISRQIELGLAPKVNWKTALRKMVQKQTKKDVQYNKPNRIFLSQDILLPTEIPDNLNTIDNVVIAIDTSGQISDIEIGQALTQIAQLLKKFKAHGEIMYWDTQVAAVAEFQDVRSALKLRPAGGGGTDPNCIFEYINNDKKYRSRSKLTKLDAILVFTDGYFGDIDEDWKRKFGRKTVWIISDPQFAERGWQAPMGLTAPFKMD